MSRGVAAAEGAAAMIAATAAHFQVNVTSRFSFVDQSMADEIDPS
jgi:hypothetical protein